MVLGVLCLFFYGNYDCLGLDAQFGALVYLPLCQACLRLPAYLFEVWENVEGVVAHFNLLPFYFR